MTRGLCLTAFILLCAVPAAAQTRSSGPPTRSGPTAGIRVGVSGGPGQFVIGGHIETRPVIDHLTFRPNVHVGIGDDHTVLAFNFEFAYWIAVGQHPWRVYVGGGPALVIGSADEPHGEGTHVGGGFNLLLGLQHRRGLFTEIKGGFIDSPEVVFAVGWVFNQRR